MTIRLLITMLSLGLLSSVIALGQSSKQELNDQLWEAVRQGDATAVTALLDKGADVNARFRYGTTALFKAAERGHAEIVKILLSRGADTSVKDTFYGATAMSWALQNGHDDVVKELLEKDAQSVEEVLVTGVQEGKPTLVKLAIAKGGVGKDAMTRALVIASANKDAAETVELLKQAGAVPPPEVNAATLQSYVAKYKSETGFEVTISLANGSLLATVTGQRPFPLYPIDDTTFKTIVTDAISVTFKVEDGKASGFALKQGQNTTQLTRVKE